MAGALLFGRLWWIRQRSVYTMQNSYQNYKLRNRLLVYAAFPFYRRLVLCSQAALDSLPPLLRRLGGGRLRVVQNAVDVARVDRALARVPPRPQPDAFRVVSVGRLIPIKNPLTLVEAFAGLSDEDARLVFVGDGELRERLAASARDKGLSDRIELTGLVPRDEVFARVARADVFVSASRGEGLPVAVIEAMACGAPAILSDIAPHREIADGVDFVPIVDPDDVTGFCREIDRVRRLSPEGRRDLGRCCRRLVIERFGLPRMHELLGRVYDELGPRDR